LTRPQLGDFKLAIGVHSVDDLSCLKTTQIAEKKSNKGIQEEVVLEIADSLNLFHDQYREPYVFIDNEAIKITSSDFKYRLSSECHSRTGKFPSDYELKKIINVLAGIAICGCNQQELFVRVAKKGNSFYFDLCAGEVVVIRSGEWFVTKAPILFRRYNHQSKQVLPVKGGNPWRVFEFVNVPVEHQILVLAAITSNFIPDIPHPIFHPYGPQGSGKSSLFRVIKKLCDPSAMEIAITPRDRHDLIQKINHHHVCLFDNLSDLPAWVSDILAMACTGAGFSKRKLYTDDDDVIMQVKRCIGVNGINTLISKPDLMDRAILLPLERIDSSKRREERGLWNSFEAAKPEILGGMFDALSRAIEIHPTVRIGSYPRMADFSGWGYAIAEALGKTGEQFLQEYQENIERQNEEVIQSNALAQAVISFMEDKSEWKGTVHYFFNELLLRTHVPKDDPSFPKHANQLRRWLNRIKVNLAERGITFEIGKFRSREGVIIEVFKKL
jgi:hypothetical protein